MKEQNKFTEYTFNRKYGIDDLKSEYAFYGNSQGDESVSNDIKVFEKSEGWMSYNFKDIPLIQSEINKEVSKRKKYNDNYVKLLKKEGKYGKEYNQTLTIENNPTFDNFSKTNKVVKSFKFIILDLNKIN